MKKSSNPIFSICVSPVRAKGNDFVAVVFQHDEVAKSLDYHDDAVITSYHSAGFPRLRELIAHSWWLDDRANRMNAVLSFAVKDLGVAEKKNRNKFASLRIGTLLNILGDIDAMRKLMKLNKDIKRGEIYDLFFWRKFITLDNAAKCLEIAEKIFVDEINRRLGKKAIGIQMWEWYNYVGKNHYRDFLDKYQLGVAFPSTQPVLKNQNAAVVMHEDMPYLIMNNGGKRKSSTTVAIAEIGCTSAFNTTLCNCFLTDEGGKFSKCLVASCEAPIANRCKAQ